MYGRLLASGVVPHRRRSVERTALRLLAAVWLVGGCTTSDAALTSSTDAFDMRTLPTLDSISPDARARLSNMQMLFGHQSVGRNVMSGMRELARSDSSVRVQIAPLAEGALTAPGFLHFEVGTNGDPDSKGAAFAQTVAAHAADGVLAGYELCYLDFTVASDGDTIFRRYQDVTDSVRSQHPGVRLVHFTAPLTTEEPAPKRIIKQLLGRPTTRALNAQRARFNSRMRETYGGREPLFDLARAESTLEDGRRYATTVDGVAVEALAPEFAADQGHLNERGRRTVASRFLAFLATLPQ